MKISWPLNNSQKAPDADMKQTFGGMTESQLLDQFKTGNWNALNEENRVSLLQEMENRNAAAQGREPAEVMNLTTMGNYGQFNGETNGMEINVSSYSSYETLDTYIHESNHAYQHHCVETGTGYDRHTLDMMQAELARDENGGLYNYARQSPEYDMQCNELDSNNRAANFLIKEHERFAEDPEYAEYIDERAKHFEEVENDLGTKGEERDNMQKEQMRSAYVRGDVTKEQFDRTNETIENKDYTDKTVEECRDTTEALKETQRDLSAARDAEENTEDNDNDNDYGGITR
jgi:hypothetical protein